MRAVVIAGLVKSLAVFSSYFFFFLCKYKVGLILVYSARTGLGRVWAKRQPMNTYGIVQVC